jgi:3-deoxy-D-manno-octulosonic acid kinase
VSAGNVPPGYARRRVGDARLVVRDALADAVSAALVGPDGGPRTLYDYARAHPRARGLAGRAPAYAVPLPDGVTRVVVRHSRHGGLFAPLTGDRFLRPTRAPRELAASLRLAAAGVPTPEVSAYVLYPAGPFFWRADVATREIADATDLAEALSTRLAGHAKARLLEATAGLLRALAAAGARHPDLNLKNVLLAADGSRLTAYVLDVDRVVFRHPGDTRVARQNFARLARSARKWRDRRDATVTEADLATLAAAAGVRP